MEPWAFPFLFCMPCTTRTNAKCPWCRTAWSPQRTQIVELWVACQLSSHMHRNNCYCSWRTWKRKLLESNESRWCHWSPEIVCVQRAERLASSNCECCEQTKASDGHFNTHSLRGAMLDIHAVKHTTLRSVSRSKKIKMSCERHKIADWPRVSQKMFHCLLCVCKSHDVTHPR